MTDATRDAITALMAQIRSEISWMGPAERAFARRMITKLEAILAEAPRLGAGPFIVEGHQDGV